MTIFHGQILIPVKLNEFLPESPQSLIFPQLPMLKSISYRYQILNPAELYTTYTTRFFYLNFLRMFFDTFYDV